QEFLGPLNLTRLSNDEAIELARPIKETEIKETILKLKNNKTPGIDGFPGEYYKTFVNELTPVLCKTYNYALEKVDPPKSWSEAIISVIRKEGKNQHNVGDTDP
ncbi:hypothetical protein LDENG_00047860, partial [Lucifuga dentata]